MGSVGVVVVTTFEDETVTGHCSPAGVVGWEEPAEWIGDGVKAMFVGCRVEFFCCFSTCMSSSRELQRPEDK